MSLKVALPAYPGVSDVGELETALYEAVADRLGITAAEVAVELCGCHGVPSDAFYAAYDDEVATLTDRYRAQRAERGGPRS